VRIVSWNVRSLRDGSWAVAEALRELAPDLVCLQEAPRLLGWRTSRLRLARRAGLRGLTRQRAGGNLLLGGPQVHRLSGAALAMPRRPGLHARAVAVARVRLDGRELWVAGTHLDLEPAARLDSARRVRAALADGPVVLGADVNDLPGSPAWQALAHGLQDAGAGASFPARAPDRRLDALLVDPALEVLAHQVVATGGASDHLALCVDLRWREPARGPDPAGL